MKVKPIRCFCCNELIAKNAKELAEKIYHPWILLVAAIILFLFTQVRLGL